MAGLHQLNVRYDPLEDRLVLNVRTADDSHYRVWLTRRFTRLLLALLEAMVERAVEETIEAPTPTAASPGPAPAPAETRRAVKSFQRESALAKVDFSTEFREAATHHPLGEAPLLASRIDYRPLDNGSLSLTLVVSETRGVNLVLDRDLQFAVIKLLEEGAAKAEWELVAADRAEPPPAVVRGADTVVH